MAFDSYNVIKEKIILLSLVALLEKMLTVDAYFASKSLTSWKNSVRSAKKFLNIRFVHILICTVLSNSNVF